MWIRISRWKEVTRLSLNDLWFILIGVLFTGFFFLEGFDFGVGMATRIIAKRDQERGLLVQTIGPFWDANEVWLITAAGAMFAAFPNWYATMFSGYYIVLTLILLALIARAVAFEFRERVDNLNWRRVWDFAIFIGSFAPPLLFGIMFTSMIQGVPINEQMELAVSFSDVVNGYSLWGGVTITGLCLLHGLTFISLRTVGELRERARVAALKLLPIQSLLLAVLVVWTALTTDLLTVRTIWTAIVIVLGVVTVAYGWYCLKQRKEGWAFAMSGATILLVVATMFIGLFPNVMISSLDEAFNLTVTTASSSDYTLKAMTIVAVILLPFVLAYQAWSYYVFRKRIGAGGNGSPENR